MAVNPNKVIATKPRTNFFIVIYLSQVPRRKPPIMARDGGLFFLSSWLWYAACCQVLLIDSRHKRRSFLSGFLELVRNLTVTRLLGDRAR